MTQVEKVRAVWTSELKKVVLDLWVEHVKSGGRPSFNLKPTAWRKVVVEFYRNTRKPYDQKQCKNLWDPYKNYWAAWVKLLTQTGIGYNAMIQKVEMEADRWTVYIASNPYAKPFKDHACEFPEELEIVFGSTSSSGDSQCTPSFGIFPTDGNGSCFSSGNISFNNEPHSPQSSGHGLSYIFPDVEDVALEDQLNDLRHKRPCRPKKKDKAVDPLDRKIDCVLGTLALVHGFGGPTIKECIESLKAMENIDHDMYVFAMMAFRSKENIEVWMSETSRDCRLDFLKAL